MQLKASGFTVMSFYFQQVKAVYHNGAPIPGNKVYVYEGDRWSPRSVQNVTTDSAGVASFTLHTDDLEGDVQLYVSCTKTTVCMLSFINHIILHHRCPMFNSVQFIYVSVPQPGKPDTNSGLPWIQNSLL